MLVVSRVVPVLGAVRTLGRGGNGRPGGAGIVETAVFAGYVWFALLRDWLLSDGDTVGLLVWVVVDDGVADRVGVYMRVVTGVGAINPIDGDDTGVALVSAHLAKGA